MALIIIPSTKRLKTLAVSKIGSPLPICKSLEDKKIALPPNWYIPTSKETLVLVDDFWKIIANVLPSRGFSSISPALILLAKSRICSTSSFISLTDNKLPIKNSPNNYYKKEYLLKIYIKCYCHFIRWRISLNVEITGTSKNRYMKLLVTLKSKRFTTTVRPIII